MTTTQSSNALFNLYQLCNLIIVSKNSSLSYARKVVIRRTARLPAVILTAVSFILCYISITARLATHVMSCTS